MVEINPGSMSFPMALLFLKEKPGERYVKRRGWEWACITWHEKIGPYRGDTFKGDYKPCLDPSDWLAEDWIACAPYGKPLS
jgi:hypothetical protein